MSAVELDGMETEAAGTDMGIGLSVLFSLLAVGGTVAMLAGGMADARLTAAAGFALAMVAAVLAVAVTHFY